MPTDRLDAALAELRHLAADAAALPDSEDALEELSHITRRTNETLIAVGAVREDCVVKARHAGVRQCRVAELCDTNHSNIYRIERRAQRRAERAAAEAVAATALEEVS